MIAKLHIETSVRADKTILKACFHTPPFKVLDITEDRRDPALHLMLMNASPGILDGDQYHLQIDVAAGSSVQLHTQSYQRLFQMKHGASQHIKVNLQEGSSLCYVPHPTVPHNASDFTAKNKIHLANNCTLLWGDVLTCGRKGSGEQFQFSKYHSVTEVFLNGRLVVKENLILQPALHDVTVLGQLEGYTHQASLIYLNENAAVKSIADKVQHLLSQQSHICFGVTGLPVNGLMVRLLGFSGEHLHGLLKKLAAQIQALQKHSRKKSYAS